MVPQMTKIFRFKHEFNEATRKRRGFSRGRLYGHTTIEIRDIQWSSSGYRFRLSLIETPIAHRNEGSARAALTWLCELADKYEMNIALSITPWDDHGMDEAQLRAWYHRYGFLLTEHDNDDMLRYPKCAS